MLELSQLEGFNGAPQKITLDYRTFVFNSADQTSYTFSSVDIGAAGADRVLLLGLTKGGASLSSFTITPAGGSAITPKLVASFGDVFLYAAVVPAATTADIAVGFSGSPRACGVGVWRVLGLRSLSAVHSSSIPGANPATSLASASLKIPAGGIAIFLFNRAFGTGGVNAWTGATAKWDTEVDAGTPQRFSGAEYQAPTTEHSKSASVSFASSNVSDILAVSML